MIMMPHSRRWSSLQLTGQADFWHPTGSAAAAASCWTGTWCGISGT